MNPILVTGFEPFDGPQNVTAELLRGLEERPPKAGPRLRTGLLPCRTRSVFSAYQALSPKDAGGVLLLGQASARARIDLELFAYNLLDFRAPDCDGVLKTQELLDPQGPPRRASTLPRCQLEALATSQGPVPVGLSEDPGRYLCNQIYYQALGLTPKLPVLFVHVPRFQGQAGAEEALGLPTREALRSTLEEILRRLFGAPGQV